MGAGFGNGGTDTPSTLKLFSNTPVDGRFLITEDRGFNLLKEKKCYYPGLTLWDTRDQKQYIFIPNKNGTGAYPALNSNDPTKTYDLVETGISASGGGIKVSGYIISGFFTSSSPYSYDNSLEYSTRNGPVSWGGSTKESQTEENGWKDGNYIFFDIPFTEGGNIYSIQKVSGSQLIPTKKYWINHSDGKNVKATGFIKTDETTDADKKILLANGGIKRLSEIFTFICTDGIQYIPETKTLISNKSAWWSDSAKSNCSYSGDCYVNCTVDQQNQYIMVGLSSKNGNHYDQIDYALYPESGGNLHRYENGSSIESLGSYQAGDELRVEAHGNKIYYIKNGQILRTTSRNDKKLHAYVCFYEKGSLSNVEFGSLSSLDPGEGTYVKKSGDEMSGTLSFGHDNEIPNAGIHILDLRDNSNSPGMFGSSKVNWYFDIQADGNWKSIMHMTGWSHDSYCSWELAGPSSTYSDSRLFYRDGINGSWTGWKKIAFDDSGYDFHCNNCYASSDKRLKTNITPSTINSYYNVLNKINLYEFNWKDKNNYQGRNFGTIAQELEQIVPEHLKRFFVNEDNSDNHYLSINDGKLVYLTIGALQEQLKINEELKNKNNELEKRLAKLEEILGVA